MTVKDIFNAIKDYEDLDVYRVSSLDEVIEHFFDEIEEV